MKYWDKTLYLISDCVFIINISQILKMEDTQIEEQKAVDQDQNSEAVEIGKSIAYDEKF